MRQKSNKSKSKTPKSDKLGVYGAGYLYHYHTDYAHFNARFEEVGGKCDIYETLAVHFMTEPDQISDFVAGFNGKPFTLHSSAYALGDVQRPSPKKLDKLQYLVKNSNCTYIGEHLAMMGLKDYYSGGFLQAIGTDEQTEVMIKNVNEAKKHSNCPIIFENASQFYHPVGTRSIAQQMAEVAEATDTGILLSLSNVYISDKFLSQDREKFLSEIPVERIKQLHLICNNAAEEKMPHKKKAAEEQAWMLKKLEEYSKMKDFKPSSIIFELEAMTDSIAEPERLRDMLDMARDLCFPSFN